MLSGDWDPEVGINARYASAVTSFSNLGAVTEVTVRRGDYPILEVLLHNKRGDAAVLAPSPPRTASLRAGAEERLRVRLACNLSLSVPCPCDGNTRGASLWPSPVPGSPLGRWDGEERRSWEPCTLNELQISVGAECLFALLPERERDCPPQTWEAPGWPPGSRKLASDCRHTLAGGAATSRFQKQPTFPAGAAGSFCLRGLP